MLLLRSLHRLSHLGGSAGPSRFPIQLPLPLQAAPAKAPVLVVAETSAPTWISADGAVWVLRGSTWEQLTPVRRPPRRSFVRLRLLCFCRPTGWADRFTCRFRAPLVPPSLAAFKRDLVTALGTWTLGKAT